VGIPKSIGIIPFFMCNECTYHICVKCAHITECPSCKTKIGYCDSCHEIGHYQRGCPGCHSPL
jgi:hypothetical protein